MHFVSFYTDLCQKFHGNAIYITSDIDKDFSLLQVIFLKIDLMFHVFSKLSYIDNERFERNAYERNVSISFFQIYLYLRISP